MSDLLPPLPGSDPETLRVNKYIPFYKKTPREIWGENRIENIKMEKPKKCEHYFEERVGSVFCKKCHMGLNGNFKVKDGHIYIRNKKIL